MAPPPRRPQRTASYLLHPDEYLPRARLRDTDAASLITMLEERASLLGGGGGSGGRSASSLSARLCEIEDSDEEGGAGGARHTDV